MRVEECVGEMSTAVPSTEASQKGVTRRSRSSIATDARTLSPLRDVSRTATSSGAGASPATVPATGVAGDACSRPTLSLVPHSSGAPSVVKRSRVKLHETREMCRLYETGLTIYEVAHRTGRSFGTVHRHLHAAGVEVEPRYMNRRPRPDRVPHAEMERTVELYESGLSMPEVGRKLYLSPSGVKRRMEQAGVPRRSRREAAALAAKQMPWRLGAEVEQCLIVLYGLGVPMAEITRWMGVSRSAVTRVAKRNGVALRRRSPTKVIERELTPASTRQAAKVDNAPLRQAFVDSGLTATEVAERCGWLQRGNADTSRVKRVLGILPESSNGRRYHRREVGSDTAALVAGALGLDPWEVGA